jgi:acetolactate decarboxylase
MKLAALLLLPLILLAGGCRSPYADTVTQVATIDALLAGAYDGTVPCGDLTRYGDFGIGTFDRLAGEMVVLDGRVYQVPSTGTVREVAGSLTTPFACVCRFEPNVDVKLPEGADYTTVKQAIDSRMGNANGVYAIHMSGTFARMKTRSVPAQGKPYRPLAEVAKEQSVFDMENITGDVVGFYLPPFVKGINVPGYHLHFLSADRKQGGHILDFEVHSGTVSIDPQSRMYLLLDNPPANVDLKKDRSRELHQVEVAE